MSYGMNGWNKEIPGGDTISRAAAIQYVNERPWMTDAAKDVLIDKLKRLPSVQPTINGYDIRHLELIAAVLQKENLPPERVTEALTDIGSIVAIVTEEFEETLRKAVEQCMT